MTADQIRSALDDFQAVAITLFGEAALEPIDGKVGVGAVIRNRLLTPRRFGLTFRAVCHQRSQFSCWWSFGGVENYERVMAIAHSFAEHTTLPLDGVALAVFQECAYVAEGIIGGQLRSNVGKATHYYNPAAMVPRGREPEWAVGLMPVAIRGSHRFYAGVK